MSSAPRMRRTDKLMAEDQTLTTLQRGFAGHLATVSEDGHPYCLPLLYVWMDGRVFLHNSRAKGHLRANVDHDQRVCFAVDERGEVFAYGRFECDSAVTYRSAIVFGTIEVIEDVAIKQRFCEQLMAKYAKPEWQGDADARGCRAVADAGPDQIAARARDVSSSLILPALRAEPLPLRRTGKG
jgi:nitroimidazol reductase NimA-like FMN-containing flavoprotein (pyridoxamine 5'-phosphate oxidase superfamily)